MASTTGHLPAYRFHRRFLQHLQHQAGAGRRWVLKCPDHVFALDALLATYPDARLVFLHRDPMQVLPSVAQLTETLRAPFTRRLDRAEIGRQIAADWSLGADIMAQEALSPRLPIDRTLHLRFQDATARPLETVTSIYRHFGLELTPAGSAAIAQQIAARPRGRYGENRYSLSTHGLDGPALQARFAGYCRLFGVASPDAASRATRSANRHPGAGFAPVLPSAPG